jgi:hypothetical protein
MGGERTAVEEARFRAAVGTAVTHGATLRELRTKFGLLWASKAAPSSWWRQGQRVPMTRSVGTTLASAGSCGASEITEGTSPSDMTMFKPGFFVSLDLKTHYVIAKWRYDHGPEAPGIWQSTCRWE